MADEIDRKEQEILRILDEQAGPIGSGLLSQVLQARGLVLSEATVGRLLSEMDRKGYTRKAGFQGRAITETGKKRLVELNDLQQRMTYGNRFLDTLSSKKKEDLIDILVARRAVERELARLAAIHSTDAEIRLMEAVVSEQEKHFTQKEMSAEQDIKFHKLIAMTAKNRVLTTALDLIRQDVQLTPILENIRVQVGGKMVVGHRKIVQAIQDRDPAAAEQAMVEHIESLISDVQKYWAITHNE